MRAKLVDYYFTKGRPCLLTEVIVIRIEIWPRLDKMVEPRRYDLLTCWMQINCSTKLSYGPMKECISCWDSNSEPRVTNLNILLLIPFTWYNFIRCFTIKLHDIRKRSMSHQDSNLKPADSNKNNSLLYIPYARYTFLISAALPLSYMTCKKFALGSSVQGNFHSLNGVNDVLVHCKEDLVVNLITITYPFSKGNSNMLL